MFLDISAKWVGYSELFANGNCCRILDFAMPWDGAGSLGSSIVIDALLGPLAEKNATICLQVAN
jgi:hypothetical protein